jgi:molecular chaperone IbpA
MVTQSLLPNDPFFRTSIGFDRIFNTLERLNSTSNATESYPPYNIIRTSDDCFVVELALAGFNKEELDVEVKESVLHIKGEKLEEDGKRNYIHKGIGGRRFHKSFTLAEFVEVHSVNFVNGILSLQMERIVPDEKKPRKLEIGSELIQQPVLLTE